MARLRDARATIRGSTVGDLLPRTFVGTGRARRLEAAAFVIPGHGDLAAYTRDLTDHGNDFADWDGRVAVLDSDGVAEHQVVIVDRYGQIYETTSALDVRALPTPAALEEWFKFLSTTCPECGVIDDPRPRDWVP
jgi:hypothetical protein